jgi:hypothetical protein
MYIVSNSDVVPRDFLYPSLVEVLPFVEIKSCTLDWTCIWTSGYMVRFPRKTKTLLVGVEKIVRYITGIAYYTRRKGSELLAQVVVKIDWTCTSTPGDLIPTEDIYSISEQTKKIVRYNTRIIHKKKGSDCFTSNVYTLPLFATCFALIGVLKLCLWSLFVC